MGKLESEIPPSYESATANDGMASTSHPNEMPPKYSPVSGEPDAAGQIRAERIWSHEMFFCFSDISSCLMTLLCPCVPEYLTAKAAKLKRIGIALALTTCASVLLSLLIECLWTYQVSTMAGNDNETEIKETPAMSFTSKCLGSLVSCLAISRFLMGLYLRSQIRRRFNIGLGRGVSADLEDAACVFCCYSCALCQEFSTMKKFEKEGVTPYAYPPMAMQHV